MKVGTDGVLLGAWADLGGAGRILDIGTGSGLVALMAAQRSRAVVVGVEIDADSARQAAENAQASPFADRVEIVAADIRRYSPPEPFGCVLSNPPFFEEDLLPPDPARAAARHTLGLPFAALVSQAFRLLEPGGLFQLIVPYPAKGRLTELCADRGLSLLHATEVITVPRKPPRRALLRFVKGPSSAPPAADRLVLTAADGTRSADYAALTADFYL